MNYTITIAKSDRGNYHISQEEGLTTLCTSRVEQRETWMKPAVISIIRREFDSIPYQYRCDSCMEKALDVQYRKGGVK